ncbi:MAG: hypothetical protein ABH819_00690 [Patescibacteria group bacterium]
MIILRKIISKSVYTLVIIVLSSTLTAKYVEWKKNDQSSNLSTKEKFISSDTPSNEVSEAGNIKDLKKEYFDDLDSMWGNSDNNGQYIPRVFSSEYSPRSLPKSINYPDMVDNKKREIIFVKRSEIKPPFGIPEGPDKGKFTGEESVAVENNYTKYGSLFGGFFSNNGEYIYSVVNADVDKDGLEEKLIITGQIGGNHPPNNGYIVKNSTIVASVGFAGGTIYPAKDGNGFYVKQPDYSDAAMCCPKRYSILRVIYENEKYFPVWEQKIEYLSF